MMLVLAVRTDPERVYRRALAYFTPAELAEAFAATSGVASPTQLRAFVKRDPRDLLGAFRALAPPREPIALQRWSLRRVALGCAVLAAIVVPVYISGKAFFPAGDIGVNPPVCGTGHSMILAAQAVPSAAQVPCVSALPAGWSVGGGDIASGHVTIWLDSDRGGKGALTVTLSAVCDTAGAQRWYAFPGGCVSYRFSLTPGAPRSLEAVGAGAVGFVPRARLVAYIRSTEGLALCGRGAACPG